VKGLMSDEQPIYISPDDDVTTVRERLEQIPSRKITLVIPSQTQLRSHVAWKLLYARARELNKEVLIVSSDPQVRSVAHGVKFSVAHSLESVSNAGRSKGGSRGLTGRSNTGRTRSPATATHATTAKEAMGKQGAPRSPRSTRPSLSEPNSNWSAFPLPESGIGTSHEPRARRSPLSEQNEMRDERSSHYNQIYDFHPDASSSILPLPFNQIEEEPDLLIEDYAQAQDIREAASGAMPVLPQPQASAPEMSPTSNVNVPMPAPPVNQSPQPQVYAADDPFIYMQDDSQPPSQSEQKGEAILQDDEISQYPSLQKSALSDLPTNKLEDRIEYHGDDGLDDSIPPIPQTSITQVTPPRTPFDEEHGQIEQEPTHLLPRPYAVPPRVSRSGTVSPSRQTSKQEESPIPTSSAPSAPMSVPQAMPLPMGRAPSNASARISQSLSPRTSGKTPQQAPVQKPAGAGTPRTDFNPALRSGSRVPPSAGGRPASQTTQPRGRPMAPKSAIGTSIRPPATRNSPPRRLLIALVSIIALFVLVFAVLYLNIASTVRLTVATDAYTQSLTLTLSDKHLSGSVPATSKTQTFTKTAPEPATGSTMQSTNNATGTVYFTNTGTTSIVIPSQITLTTANNIAFVTTANALILPQSANPMPLPVAIKASNQGLSGNVAAGRITVIPPDSLTSIAQAQSSPVTVASLQTTLSVSNPVPTIGGEAHLVPSVTQQDLDNAKNNLHSQVQPDIDAWLQQLRKTGLVGQVSTNDTLINPPAVDAPEPDKTFSASINVTATVLVAQLSDVQKVALDQLKKLVQADQKFPNSTIIGNFQTINVSLAQQNAGQGNSVIVPATGQVGPNLNLSDLQTNIAGKTPSKAREILQQKNQRIQDVNIQTSLVIFNTDTASPWANHITIILLPTPKKS